MVICYSSLGKLVQYLNQFFKSFIGFPVIITKSQGQSAPPPSPASFCPSPPGSYTPASLFKDSCQYEDYLHFFQCTLSCRPPMTSTLEVIFVATEGCVFLEARVPFHCLPGLCLLYFPDPPCGLCECEPLFVCWNLCPQCDGLWR